jgi:alcohol dehydrogenase
MMHNTLRGQWMYPRDAAPRMVRIVRAGMFDLNQFGLNEFALNDADDAVAYAAANAGPFHLAVLRPDRIGGDG